MSNILIGIGGTGAKVVESTLHLLAAGLLRDPQKEVNDPARAVHLGFIDSDRENGTRSRVETSLRSYVDSQPEEQPDFFGPRLGLLKVWNPVPRANETFSSILGVNPAATDGDAEALSRVLYDPGLLYVNLDDGFRGAPNLGRLVMSAALRAIDYRDTDSIWKKIDEEVRSNNDTRIVLAGSLFGGMGAAGLPAIARHLRATYPKERFPKLHLAIIPALPYFTFPTDTEDGLHALHENFVATSKNALLHYIDHGLQKDVSAIYVAGYQKPAQVPSFSIGRIDQRNPAHFIDLLAALGVMHFWRDWKPVTPETGASFYRSNHLEIDGQQAGTLRWDQLPWPVPNAPQLLTHMLRYSLAVNQSFVPRLLEYADDKVAAHEISWVLDFFGSDRANVANLKPRILAARSYAQAFLLWMAQVQESIMRPEQIAQTDDMLLQSTLYTRIDKITDQVRKRTFETVVLDLHAELLSRLAQEYPNDAWSHLYPTAAASPSAVRSLSAVWERICAETPKSLGQNSSLNGFLRQLYLACA